MKNHSVMFVTISMTGGGTERVIATLANYFSTQGCTVKIMMIAGTEVAYNLNPEIELIPIAMVSNGNIKARIARLAMMRRAIRESGISNIIAMGSVCSIWTMLASVGIRNKNIILSERNNPNRINKKNYSIYLKWLRNFLYTRANALVLQTEDSRAEFPDKLGKKAYVIGNPLPVDMIDAYEGIRTKRVVAAGRLNDDKNYPMLVKAFDSFSSSHSDYVLEIYGQGAMYDELLDKINESKNSDKMMIMPFTSNLHQVIRDSSIFVSCSNSEGLSNSILEALALGIPVIGTDCPIGGTKMLIENGYNGFLINVGDVAALIDRMIQIADSDDLKNNMSHNAINVRSLYSAENICDKWSQLFV